MVAAIDIAPTSRKSVEAAAKHITAQSAVQHQVSNLQTLANCTAQAYRLQAEMQQASAAFSNVEAEVFGLQVAVTDRVAVDSGTDNRTEHESQSPCSSCDGDFIDENQAHSEWQSHFDGEDMLSSSQLFDAANVQYSQHQVSIAPVSSLSATILTTSSSTWRYAYMGKYA